MPRDQVIEIALSGFSEARLERITRQRRLAKKFREALAVSAQLPGFQRQISDQEKHEEAISETPSPEQRKTNERWLLVRMMLTRFNWLSTRVGDDAVPVDGIVFAMISPTGSPANERKKLPPVVPLRQRQLSRLLGEDWERNYYERIYHPTEISTYVSKEDFEAALSGVSPDATQGDVPGTPTVAPNGS
jgi:hypothetical protein